jgi:hypothetical protein
MLPSDAIKFDAGKLWPRHPAGERDFGAAGVIQQANYLPNFTNGCARVRKFGELRRIRNSFQDQHEDSSAVVAQRTRQRQWKFSGSSDDPEWPWPRHSDAFRLRVCLSAARRHADRTPSLRMNEADNLDNFRNTFPTLRGSLRTAGKRTGAEKDCAKCGSQRVNPFA